MSPKHLEQLNRTISTWAFKIIVLHHITEGLPLSVIRMQDVESKIMRMISEGVSLNDPVRGYSDKIIAWSGLTGITYREVERRMRLAVQTTSYFAPSLSGTIREDYDLMKFFDHPRLVDNSFPSVWSREDKQEILDKAHSVLVIHNNAAIGDQFQKALTRHRAGFLKLENWKQCDEVIEAAVKLPHRLVLFAGSAGGKYIGPAIADSGKVVLDIGSKMEKWIPQ